MKKGKNELVIWAGIGWYLKRVPGVVAGGPYVRAQLDKLDKDGHQVLVKTDADWKAANIGHYYDGKNWTDAEVVDMRMHVKDFSSSTLDGLNWEQVVIGNIPDAALYEVNDEYSRLYDKLWRELDQWCIDNLKGEELKYYYKTTD